MKMPWWAWLGALVSSAVLGGAVFAVIPDRPTATVVSLVGGLITGSVAQHIFGGWAPQGGQRTHAAARTFGSTQDDWDYLELIASLTGTVAAKEHDFHDPVVTDAIAIAVSRAIQGQLFDGPEPRKTSTGATSVGTDE